ncbi:hypothetical protein FHS57_002439 [Runella defluvii]|uniref:Cupin domain-containing protein n=1 Tax=Runella defluvii TaxID=370973 RepID=A0A7W5ZKD3_9BACT|nr:hypothetical protein [Runella defluvii]MBB3838434.1 hypothetical protein [Runella defluvii]
MAFQPFSFAFKLLVGLALSFSLSAQHQPIASGVYVWKGLPVSKKASVEQRQILEGTTPAFKHLKVHATTLKPHQAPHPSHKHSDEELVIVKEGELTVTIEGFKIKKSPTRCKLN